MISTKVLFIILVAVSGLSFGEECPSGWEGRGNTCYVLSTDRLNWTEALHKCESEVATLASVTDSSINNYLWRGGRGNDWIGLQTTDNTDKWYWNDGMRYSSSSVFQWVDGEPNSADVCARLKPDNKIAGRECYYSDFYFICQSDSDPGSWYLIGQYWFYFSSEQGHFYYASRYCSDRGGYLAREEVVNALGSDQRHLQREYWIGLSRWYWTDGSQYTWHNFMPYSYVMHGRGLCYVLHGTENKWESRSCTETNYYICQKEKGTTSSTSPTTTTPKTTTSVLPTNSTTTKPAPSTSTTSTTATTTPPEITPPPEIRTTTKIKSIEPSFSTMESVADNDSVSDVALYTTGNSQTTVVVSSSEANELFDGDSGVIAGAVIGGMIVLTLATVIIVLLVRSRRNGGKDTPTNVTEPKTGSETVGVHSYENVRTNTKDIIHQDNTTVAPYMNVERPVDYKEKSGGNDNAITHIQTFKECGNTNTERCIHCNNVLYTNIANPQAKQNDDYEVVSNPYEQLQDRPDRTEPIVKDYQSLTLSL